MNVHFKLFYGNKQAKRLQKGQNTLIFKLILNILCQVRSILRSLWLLYQCLMRPALLFYYVNYCEPQSSASHREFCGLSRGEFTDLRGGTVHTGNLGPAKYQRIRLNCLTTAFKGQCCTAVKHSLVLNSFRVECFG